MMQKLMTLTRLGVALGWALALAGGMGIVSHHQASAAGVSRQHTVTANFKHGSDDSSDDATDDSGDDNGGDATDDSGDDNGGDATDDSGDDNGTDATDDSTDDNGGADEVEMHHGHAEVDLDGDGSTDMIAGLLEVRGR
jgi:hypothetical protein